MTLERTGDGMWFVKHTDLCGKTDEWLPVIEERLNV